MKKLQQHTFNERLRYASLHLDDIEHIVDILKVKLPEIIFRDGEFEYESLDEMKEKRGSKVKQIKIIGERPETYTSIVTLNIDERDISLSVHADYELLRYQIVSFIKSRAPWYSRITSLAFLWIFLLAILILEYPSYIEEKTKLFSPPVWLNVSVILVALLLTLSVYDITIHRGVILEKRHLLKGFFSRNSDRILMLFIGGLLTMLGRYLSTLIFG